MTGYNRNFLYHNNGDGTFTDVTEKAGVTGISSAGQEALGNCGRVGGLRQ